MDKLTEELSSFRDSVNKQNDTVNKKLDKLDEKLDEKLDKVLELLDDSNKQHMTTREHFVKVRRRMDKTDLRVSVLERNAS